MAGPGRRRELFTPVRYLRNETRDYSSNRRVELRNSDFSRVRVSLEI